MGKNVAFLVGLVGVLGAVAGASLMYVWVTVVHAPPPPPTMPTPKTAQGPAEAPRPPIFDVDPANLSLDGFVVGMSAADAMAQAKRLRISFEKGPNKDGTTAWWFVTDKNDAYWSVRLLEVNGKIEGVRVKYKILHPERGAEWSEVLKQPYFEGNDERHWETTNFKAKANRVGEKFYVVNKQYRNAFEW
ncbi:MAG: hypothetical protein R3A78_08270 [Polyangiales bacterium]|nr:hypothetical protein [Myxococcales bacterium]